MMHNIYKYEATGNDFILTAFEPNDPSAFALKTCDRHFGIGADGLLYPSPSDIADIKMNYYNADGTIAPMCGNGIRSFVQFLIDLKIMIKDVYRVETLGGLMIVSKEGQLLEVNLGKAVTTLTYPDIDGTQEDITKRALQLENKTIETYTFNLGTLHTIIYVDDVNEHDDIAHQLCHHSFFPKRSNINFVKVIDKDHLQIKTYERGVGWTLSCGTGSSASQYLSYLLGKTNKQVDISIPGGNLIVTVKDKETYLRGPARFIASIEMEI